MALRSSWEGFLQLSLISVPVRAYNTAVTGRGEIHFHLIHKDCGNRIRYQKVCPVHGEVPKEDIVSGYEYQKGEYLELDPSEIAAVKAKSDETIAITSFVDPERIDPVNYTGRSFYLVPNGPAGQKPFVLLRDIMREKNRHALARMVISGHEQTVLIRPTDELLSITVLYFASQVKKPADFSDEVGDAKVSAQELKLAGSLVDASTSDEVDLTEYRDLFTERIREVIDAKLAGRKVKAPKTEKPRPVVNLMDALKQSLQKANTGGKPKPAGQDARRHVRLHGKRQAG